MIKIKIQEATISNIKELTMLQKEDGSYSMKILGSAKLHNHDNCINCEFTAENVRLSDIDVTSINNHFINYVKEYRIELGANLIEYDCNGSNIVCQFKNLEIFNHKKY